MIIDLDKEFPEEDIIKFTTRSGVEYEVALYIPPSVGDIILDNIEIVSSLFPDGMGVPKLNKASIDLGMKILADICHEQFEEIDREWIRKNISLPRQAIILYHLIKPVYNFISGTGFMSMVEPDKKDARQ